jgi:hypothetical protein
MFMARFRRVADGKIADHPIPGVDSLEEATALAEAAAAGMDFEVEVVSVFPVTVRVIEIEMPPDPEAGDLYWPSIPGGMLSTFARLYFLLCLHRYHH